MVYTQLYLLQSSLFDGFGNEETSTNNDSFLPRRSVKRLVLKSRPSVSEIFIM